MSIFKDGGGGILCEITPTKGVLPVTLLTSRKLSLLKKIIRGIALTDKELGWTKCKSRKSLTALLDIMIVVQNET